MNRQKKNAEEQKTKAPQAAEKAEQAGRERAVTRKRNRKRRIEGFVTAAIMAVTAVVIVLVVWFQRSVDSVTFQNGLYNYFGERRLEYPGTCRLQYKDGMVTLKNGEGTYPLDSTPLYTSDGRVTVPVDYVWNDNRAGTLYRLGHFGIIRNENNVVVMTDGDREKEDARGFLYDGTDTYIFLEHVTITAGAEEVRLPAMSYVVARYGNTLQYYLAGTDKSVVVKTGEGDQLAAFGNGDTLNMGTDTLYCANGTWQLLVVRPQVLDRMK